MEKSGNFKPENIDISFAQQADEFLRNDNLAGAIDLAEAGVRKYPFYSTGHLLLARAYHQDNRMDEAQAEYERVILYEPGNYRALMSLAFISFKKRLKALGNQYLQQAVLYDFDNEDLIEYLKKENIYTPAFIFTPIAESEGQTSPAEISGTKAILPTEITDKETIEIDPEKTIAEVMNESGLVFQMAHEEQPVIDMEEEDQRVLEIVTQSVDTELPVDDSPLSRDFVDPHSVSYQAELDLSQFDNVRDDFSTVMHGIFSDSEEDKSTETPEAVYDLPAEPEAEAEERPMLDTSIIFLENKQDVETGKTLDADRVREEMDIFIDNIHEESEPAEPIQKAVYSNPVPEPTKTPEEKPALIGFKTLKPEPVIEGPADSEDGIEEILKNPKLLTPTFGEILIAQKKFNEARQVFKKLADQEPGNERFTRKVEFIERMIASINAG